MKKRWTMALPLFFSALLLGGYLFWPELLFQLVVKAGRYSGGLARKEIRVDDHNIVYLEGGKGETVLLLHGFAANKDNWIRFAAHLTGGHHVVIPDLPGFGESSRIGSDHYSAQNQIRRIDRFAEVLKLERFHLAGNSMGGMLAAIYSATYPGKVLTLALFAPGGVGSAKPSELMILLEKGINPLLTGSTEDFDRLVELCFAEPPFIPSRFKDVLAADAVAHRDFNRKIWEDLFGRVSKDSAGSRENLLLSYLQAIQAPVLIVWGEADRILDVGGVAVLEKNLKHYRTVIMKNTGHTPMLERPKEAADHHLKHLKANRVR